MSAAIEDDEDTLELVAGNEEPFTMCPTWIALSGITPQARALWWVLAMHLNMQRVREHGDREVWPGKDTIAALMNLTKPTAIDRYMDELVGIEAVKVIRRRAGRMRTRNRYVVYSRVPEAWAGPLTLCEFYERRRATASSQVAS